MRRIVSGSLSAVLVALSAIPAPAWAAATPSRPQAFYGPQEAEPGEDEDLVVLDDEEMEGEAAPAAPAEGEAAGGAASDVEASLFGEESDPVTDTAVPAGAEVGKQDANSEARQIKAEMGLITVVQRQRMLKKGRFELGPQFGITINDPYVRHYTLGLDLNYWITNRLAIGLTGTGLIGDTTPRYDNIRFQLGLLLTANRVLWQASLNLLYNPFYGKIAIFNRALLHWEGSLVIGGGATQTQVIPRFDALHDPFTTVTGGGHFGFMGRFYGPRVDWLSVNWGIRTWVFPDKLEPAARGFDEGAGDDPLLNPPAAAKEAADWEVAFNVTAFVGLSFYFPTSFEYSTPR